MKRREKAPRDEISTAGPGARGDHPPGREKLERFLSDLARVSERHGIALATGGGGETRLVDHRGTLGGYVAEAGADGSASLRYYTHGEAPTGGHVIACGDDMHPDARAERARLWREENAEAIAEQNELALRQDGVRHQLLGGKPDGE